MNKVGGQSWGAWQTGIIIVEYTLGKEMGVGEGKNSEVNFILIFIFISIFIYVCA